MRIRESDQLRTVLTMYEQEINQDRSTPNYENLKTGERTQIAYMFYEHFRATGADEAALDLSDLFTVPLQGDDIQDFDTKWDQALLAASEIPEENVLGSVYEMRIRESVQLQTVLAMCEQEIDRDRAMPLW